MAGAIVGGKSVINVAGPPVACYNGLEWCAKAVINKFFDQDAPKRYTVFATLSGDIHSGGEGFEAFIRVNLERTANGYIAHPLTHKGQRGYPVLIPSALLPRIKEPTIPEKLEDFLKERDSCLFKIDVPDLGVVNPFVEPKIEPVIEKNVKPNKPKTSAKYKSNADSKVKHTLDAIQINKPEVPPPPPNDNDFNDSLCSRQKLWLQSETGFFDPGTYRLLELTMSTKSVKTACAEMNLS
jgi:hypothetical protein